MKPLQTKRLTLSPLSENDWDCFASMVQDPYILRYLMDGEIMPKEWCLEQIHKSHELFQSHNVGMWLIQLEADKTPIGFCGFMLFTELFPEPKLTYAVYERYAGNGYVKEATEAVIEYAFTQAKMPVIYSGVDEPNTRSIRTMESMNFIRTGDIPGVFGKIYLYQLEKQQLET